LAVFFSLFLTKYVQYFRLFQTITSIQKSAQPIRDFLNEQLGSSLIVSKITNLIQMKQISSFTIVSVGTHNQLGLQNNYLDNKWVLVALARPCVARSVFLVSLTNQTGRCPPPPPFPPDHRSYRNKILPFAAPY
jgi:hypothetical protein